MQRLPQQTGSAQQGSSAHMYPFVAQAAQQPVPMNSGLKVRTGPSPRGIFTSVVVWLPEIAHPSPARYVALTPMIVAEDGAELVVVKNSGLHVGT